MRRLVVLFCLSFGVASVRADGMKFTPHAQPSPMPAQCAVLAWHDGVETLAVRTEINSGAGASVWVVPTPSVPELFDVEPGVVESARASFAPQVVDGLGGAWFVAMVSVIAVASAHLAFAARGSILPRLVILAGIVVLWLLATAVGGVRGLGAHKSVDGGAPDSPVLLHERRLVGAHEVAVISSSDPAALRQWLTGFGMTVPPAADGPIEAYCREGWAFVAARLHDAESGLQTPRPVGMRFKSDSPVYPMRLTAAGNGDEPLELELLVYGPGTARAPGMRAESSGPVELAGESSRQPWGPSTSIRVGHRGVAELVGTCAWATRLRGTLAPAQMTADLAPTFGIAEALGRRAISRGDAVRGYATGIGLAAAGVGVFTLPLANRRAWTRGRFAVAVAIALVLGASGAAKEMRGVRVVPVSSENASASPRAFESAWAQVCLASPPAESVQQARGMFETAWVQRNTRSSPPPPFGSGPGQYLIRQVTGAAGPELEFSWVNWFGQRSIEDGVVRLPER